MRKNKAFTLIELLVVIAIIAILAAILFPVFAQAKAAAKKAACLSNFKQLNLAVQQYMADADDVYPLVETTGTYSSVPPDADDVVQTLVWPYMKNEDILASPGDPATKDERITRELTDPNTVPAQYRTAQRRLNLGVKSDFGVNVQFFGPWGYLCPRDDGGTGTLTFKGHAVKSSQVGAPANALYAITSVWNRSSSGAPYGGGNYALDAPCFADASGLDLRPPRPGCAGYWWFGGWNPGQPLAWNVFGGAWPWHNDNANTAFADGHAKTMKISATTKGCDVRNGSAGRVSSTDDYMWDLN